MENDILDSLNDLGYQGPLNDEVAFSKALEGGPKSLEFTKLIHILAEELKKLCNLEEAISVMNDPDESSSFLLELSSFLKELGCPYKCLVTGHMSSRLQSKEDRLLLLDYMVSEVMAGRMVQVDCPKDKQAAGMEIIMQESPTAKDLKEILIALKFNKPPPNITPEMLFTKLESKLKDTLQKEGDKLVGKPLYNKALSEKDWRNLETTYSEMFEEYRLRRETLITRLECTIQSFEWSDRLKSKKDTIQSVYRPKREALKVKPNVKLSDFLAARTSLLHVEKTSSASVRKNTQSNVNKVIIGQKMTAKLAEIEKKLRERSKLHKLNDGHKSSVSEGATKVVTSPTSKHNTVKSPKSKAHQDSEPNTLAVQVKDHNGPNQSNRDVNDINDMVQNEGINTDDRKQSKKVASDLDKQISVVVEKYRNISQTVLKQLHEVAKGNSISSKDKTQTNENVNEYALQRQLEVELEKEMTNLINQQHMAGIIQLVGKQPRSMRMSDYEKEELVDYIRIEDPKENIPETKVSNESKTEKIDNEIVDVQPVNSKEVTRSNNTDTPLDTPAAMNDNAENIVKKIKKTTKNESMQFNKVTRNDEDSEKDKVNDTDAFSAEVPIVIRDKSGKHFDLYKYMLVRMSINIALNRYMAINGEIVRYPVFTKCPKFRNGGLRLYPKDKFTVNWVRVTIERLNKLWIGSDGLHIVDESDLGKSNNYKPSKKTERRLNKEISRLIDKYREIPKMSAKQLQIVRHLEKENTKIDDFNKDVATTSATQLNDPDEIYKMKKQLRIQIEKEMSDLIYQQHLQGLIQLPGKQPRSTKMAPYERDEVIANANTKPQNRIKENTPKDSTTIKTEDCQPVEHYTASYTNIASLYLKTPQVKQNLENSRKKSKKGRKNDPKPKDSSGEKDETYYTKDSKKTFDPNDDTLHIVVQEKNGTHFDLYTYMLVRVSINIALKRYQLINGEDGRLPLFTKHPVFKHGGVRLHPEDIFTVKWVRETIEKLGSLWKWSDGLEMVYERDLIKMRNKSKRNNRKRPC